MSVSQALSAAGLIRPTRRRRFCPACRGWDAGTADHPRRAEGEVSPPALTALAFLALAAVAWAGTIWQSRGAAEMEMSLGSLESFAISWAVMMAAMMLPSALPLVYEFALRWEGRRRWQALPESFETGDFDQSWLTSSSAHMLSRQYFCALGGRAFCLFAVFGSRATLLETRADAIALVRGIEVVPAEEFYAA